MTIRQGDQLILVNSKGKRFFLSLDEPGKTHRLPGLGSLASDFFFDKEFGQPFKLGMDTVMALPLTLEGELQTIKRKAQIITPKDAAAVLFFGDIRPGQRVLEVGSGSGAMTLALARAVSPGGEVCSYDIREDFSDFARQNTKAHGLEDVVTFRVRDIFEGSADGVFHRIVVDIPQPWPSLPQLYDAMETGGVLTLYLPSANQVIQTLEHLEGLPFMDIRVMCSDLREYKANAKAFRPENQQLVHTAYLVFARKVLQKI